MAEKIKISDLFDFSDVQDLQELYRRLEQINQIYKELAKNISQESQTINKGIEANVKEVKKLSDALKVAGDKGWQNSCPRSAMNHDHDRGWRAIRSR